MYFIPIIVMAVTYILIVQSLWKRNVPGEQTDGNLYQQRKAKQKVCICIMCLKSNTCMFKYGVLIIKFDKPA